MALTLDDPRAFVRDDVSNWKGIAEPAKSRRGKYRALRELQRVATRKAE
jgi:hypothetical protein